MCSLYWRGRTAAGITGPGFSSLAWVGFHTLALFYDIAHVSSSSAPAWTVIASVAFWLVELSALVLILSKRSSRITGTNQPSQERPAT